MGVASSYFYRNGGMQAPNNCEGPFEFIVLTEQNQYLVFSDFKVEQEIIIKLNNDSLPKLEIIRLDDNILIGLVPPTFSKLIKCISEGWKYYGKITKIEGNEFDPKIYVKVQGEK